MKWDYILDKINQLKDKFARGDAQDIGIIDNWYEDAKRLILLDNLSGHDGVKYIIQAYQADVEKINSALKTMDSKELPDKYRDRLLDRRDMAQKMLDLFLPVTAELEKIEEDVDNELSKS